MYTECDNSLAVKHVLYNKKRRDKISAFYGPEESRTPDLYCAIVALYQLSHWPSEKLKKIEN